MGKNCTKNFNKYNSYLLGQLSVLLSIVLLIFVGLPLLDLELGLDLVAGLAGSCFVALSLDQQALHFDLVASSLGFDLDLEASVTLDLVWEVFPPDHLREKKQLMDHVIIKYDTFRVDFYYFIYCDTKNKVIVEFQCISNQLVFNLI